MFIYNLLVNERDEPVVVTSFTTPREAYRFIDKHIKPLTDSELDSLDRGYNKPVGSVLYHYIGLTLEIRLSKDELKRSKR